MNVKSFLLAGAMCLAASSTFAACAFENKTEVKVLTSSFPAWKAVTAAMAECGNVKAELDADFRKKHAAAFAAKPSLYHIGGVANGTLVPLLGQGTIRPLDDLVAKYGSDLSPNQFIKIDGKIMAVSTMVNAQHMMYREDIFADLGLEAPKTYDDVLAAAEKIKAAGVVDYPLGGTYKTGWNVAQEFVNMFLGFEGEFFREGNLPNINNNKGVGALEMMKKLTAYMDPEYLVSDSTYVQQQFQQSKIAMANLWATRAAAMNDAKESVVAGKVKMSSAPAAITGKRPASTIWWDGIVVAKNISDEEAEAAFKVGLEGIDEEMVKANNDLAIWTIKGYVPGALAEGAAATATGGAVPYPASEKMGLMHTAIGNTIADFLTDKKDAETTLADIEAAYLTSAKEAGLVK